MFGGGFALKKYKPSSFEAIKNGSVRGYDNLKRGVSYTGETIKRSLSKKSSNEKLDVEAENVVNIPSKPEKTFAGEVAIDMKETEEN